MQNSKQKKRKDCACTKNACTCLVVLACVRVRVRVWRIMGSLVDRTYDAAVSQRQFIEMRVMTRLDQDASAKQMPPIVIREKKPITRRWAELLSHCIVRDVYSLNRDEMGGSTTGHACVTSEDKKHASSHHVLLTYGEILPSGVSIALGPLHLDARNAKCLVDFGLLRFVIVFGWCFFNVALILNVVVCVCDVRMLFCVWPKLGMGLGKLVMQAHLEFPSLEV